MSIVRVGTTKKYSEGWDRIFGKGKKKESAAKKKSTAKKGKRSKS